MPSYVTLGSQSSRYEINDLLTSSKQIDQKQENATTAVDKYLPSDSIAKN
jgi:hypothetical protein